MSSNITFVVPRAEIGWRNLTWKWYVKHELIILALFLIVFGLAWVIFHERVDQVETDMPAYIQSRDLSAQQRPLRYPTLRATFKNVWLESDGKIAC